LRKLSGRVDVEFRSLDEVGKLYRHCGKDEGNTFRGEIIDNLDRGGVWVRI